MSKVITFSRTFPKGHSRQGSNTYFVEKICNSIGIDHRNGILKNYTEPFDYSSKKNHTIRGGKNWKVGDTFSPRFWSGKPYHSEQVKICDDLTVKEVYDIIISCYKDDSENYAHSIKFLDKRYDVFGYGNYDKPILYEIAKNDGLHLFDLYDWILPKMSEKEKLSGQVKFFFGQIICWNPVNYHNFKK